MKNRYCSGDSSGTNVYKGRATIVIKLGGKKFQRSHFENSVFKTFLIFQIVLSKEFQAFHIAYMASN